MSYEQGQAEHVKDMDNLISAFKKSGHTLYYLKNVRVYDYISDLTIE